LKFCEQQESTVSHDPWYTSSPPSCSSSHKLSPQSLSYPQNDFGGAFAMGAIGGGIWYIVKTARNAPRVWRFMKTRAPNSGVWGGMFSTFDCVVVKGWR
ncbi:hypothetical protein BDZ89DRAFT_1228231, partial [Hymenopellis radicata]